MRFIIQTCSLQLHCEPTIRIDRMTVRIQSLIWGYCVLAYARNCKATRRQRITYDSLVLDPNSYSNHLQFWVELCWPPAPPHQPSSGWRDYLEWTYRFCQCGEEDAEGLGYGRVHAANRQSAGSYRIPKTLWIHRKRLWLRWLSAGRGSAGIIRQAIECVYVYAFVSICVYVRVVSVG